MRMYKEMRAIAVVLWFFGCTRLYSNGKSVGSVYRVWHPLTWVLVLMLTPWCLARELRMDRLVPLHVSPFWQRHRTQLQWVTPFTNIQRLKPFEPEAYDTTLLGNC